eukprot:TRINITY_DN55367_c0_g1_i1.p1 TRINITY_DN55367_c0_g1~~TRINITY_DN55367_c0_g1_i1.p1  ORF type:complete len:509 (+),score=116.14 TRINITY_DN55367_c0_g1_i1:79-1605(+)
MFLPSLPHLLLFFFVFEGYGDHRDLHYPLRRQRQMCIRDSINAEYGTELSMVHFWEVFEHARSRIVVLPVIHTLSAEQAIRNAQLAADAGCDGVWLINHDHGLEMLVPIIRRVRTAFPDMWIGVNFLAVPLRGGLPTLAALERSGTRVDGYWADDGQIDEHSQDQAVAAWTDEARGSSGWSGLYFGGVCFKKQRVVHARDAGIAARVASQWMDVVTTSGVATGHAADLDKIDDMRAGINGTRPLAVASGITPQNLSSYSGKIDCAMVATGVATSFHELDKGKLMALMAAAVRTTPGTVAPVIARQPRSSRHLALMAPNSRGDNFAWVDPSRMYMNADALADLVADLIAPFQINNKVDLVCGLDAAGYVLGAAMALKMGVGLLTIRKANKLPVDVDRIEYRPPVYHDTKADVLEMRRPAFKRGARILLVDQWIETGGTMLASVQLIERQGGKVAGICAVNIEDNAVTRGLSDQYCCVSAAGKIGKEILPRLLPLNKTPEVVQYMNSSKL